MLESGRSAAGTLDVRSPYDGPVLETIPTGDTGHVEDALGVAYALHRDREAWLSIPERVAILSKAADIMQPEIEALTPLAASEGGKPYADSKVEVIRAIDGVHPRSLCPRDTAGRGMRRRRSQPPPGSPRAHDAATSLVPLRRIDTPARRARSSECPWR